MRRWHSMVMAMAAAAALAACREPMMPMDVVATDARGDVRDARPGDAMDAVQSDAVDSPVPTDAQDVRDVPDIVDGGCSPDLMTDPHHCGSCTLDCTTLPGAAASIRCIAGACDLTTGCRAGRAHCTTNAADGCETDITTTTNCGACGTACSEPTPMCTAASGGTRMCASGCSGATPTRCDMMCVDTTANPLHCGTCGMACTAPANGHPVCSASTCAFACNPGFAERAGACDPAFTVGGMVTGLAGGSITLQNNGGDDVTVSTDSAFMFATSLFDGAMYAVTVSGSPAGRVCTVTNGTGNVAGANVTNVMVSCRAAVVVVNEVYARPATGALGDTNGDGVRDSADDEFVELLNMESSPVDISGWVIRAGTTSPAVRHTFAAGTTLAANGRAVVFGGGTPTGGFGGAVVQTATTSLSLTDAPASAATVTLETAATGGTVVDTFMYDATTFGSSCTTACQSRTRSPEGTGAFVAHTTVSGGPGILWSPGVAANAAIPKVEIPFSIPTANAMRFSVLSPVQVQFDMFMNVADYTNTNLRLFASSCPAMTSEVTGFTSIGAGADASSARLVPSSSLAYATTYCVSVSGLHSSAGTLLDAPETWEFTTRPAMSAPSSTVVISEYGGANFSTNDEFVELFNPTGATVDISGYLIQRRTAAGTASCIATIPAGTTLPAGHFYLVGGLGYNPASYGGVTADSMATGGQISGNNESIVLNAAATSSCTSSTLPTGGVDSVSVGAITENIAVLQLPAMTGPIAAGGSIERKACFDSTGDASATTGLLPSGGHAAQGNSERIGASNADFVMRATAQPQNLASPVETRTCP